MFILFQFIIYINIYTIGSINIDKNIINKI